MQSKKGEGPSSFTAPYHLILSSLPLTSCSPYISVHLEHFFPVSRPATVGWHTTSQRLSLMAEPSISKVIMWTCSRLDGTCACLLQDIRTARSKGRHDDPIYMARGKMLMNVKCVFLVKVCLLFSWTHASTLLVFKSRTGGCKERHAALPWKKTVRSALTCCFLLLVCWSDTALVHFFFLWPWQVHINAQQKNKSSCKKSFVEVSLEIAQP